MTTQHALRYGMKECAAIREKPIAKRTSILLTGILVAAFILIGAFEVFPNAYDNDAWFILANGEYVLENGFPHENPWSIHPDMGFVMQQPIPSIVNYLIYSVSGFVGIGAWVTFLYVLLVCSMFFVGRYLRQNKFGYEILLFWILIAIVPLVSYASVRPHLYSMLSFTWVLYFCERYKRTDSIRWLIPLPLICMASVNCQAALAPFNIAIIVLYALPGLPSKAREFFKQRDVCLCENPYKRVPIIICALISCVFMCINPYGIEGATYIFHSFSAANAQNYISEMNPMSTAQGLTTYTTLIAIGCALIAMGRKGLKNINIQMCVLVFVTTVMAFLYIRNKWIAALFCCLYLAWATSSFGFKRRIPIKIAYGIACVAIIGSLVAGVFGVVDGVKTLSAYPKNTDRTPVATMDYLDKKGANRETTRVFTFFNAGGYIEYRGYKVNMDPRPELWSPSISGQDEDYYSEYLRMAKGDDYIDDYLDKYDFDIVISPKKDSVIGYLQSNDDYVEIPGGDDYRAFAKRSFAMEKVD